MRRLFVLRFQLLNKCTIWLVLQVFHDHEVTLIKYADDLAAAFEKHVQTYGGLDICVNCAGIANMTLVYDDTSDGIRTWRNAINVNFVAVIDGTRIAVSLSLSIGKKLSYLFVNNLTCNLW